MPVLYLVRERFNLSEHHVNASFNSQLLRLIPNK
ncbi:hypothetical protein EMIT0P294_270011 [Pseudomonas sp. IT-P294]